ncbi:hypothetical protein H0H92_008124 [Tricholoma furcatifolium]|nr:hypothetical protein H0H92_008124 [Tricholoma furcatifolium]
MSQSNWPVVLDDTNPQIQYIGSGWLENSTGDEDGYGTYGVTYNHTLHATQANDSFALSFQGSTIQVYGTVDLALAYNLSTLMSPSGFDPPWECYIDGISIGNSPASPYQENNWPLCESDTLYDGSHELTLNVSMKQGATFWVDYVEYTPTTPVNGSVVRVDNMDPALSYDSTWQGVDGLANMTNTQGGKVSFNFTGMKAPGSYFFGMILILDWHLGTQLIWMGYIPVEYPGNASSASYSIDNGTSTSFTLAGHPSTDGTSRYNQLFFTTPQLAPGSHNLVVTYNGNSQLTPLTLDYIYLTTSSSGNETSSTNNTGGSHHTHVGAIAGGVVGGVVLIAIIIARLFWRRKHGSPASAIGPLTSNSAVSPITAFPLQHHPTTSISSPTSGAIQPFQASSSGLLSSESLAHSHAESHLYNPNVDGTFMITNTTPSQGVGYISGAKAQIGDFKKPGRHQAFQMDAVDEVQPPQYTA